MCSRPHRMLLMCLPSWSAHKVVMLAEDRQGWAHFFRASFDWEDVLGQHWEVEAQGDAGQLLTAHSTLHCLLQGELQASFNDHEFSRYTSIKVSSRWHKDIVVCLSHINLPSQIEARTHHTLVELYIQTPSPGLEVLRLQSRISDWLKTALDPT